MDDLSLHGLIGDAKSVKYVISGSHSLSSTVNNIAISLDDYEYATVEIQVDDLILPSKSIYDVSEVMVGAELTSNTNLRLTVETDLDDAHVIYTITQYNKKALKKAVQRIVDSGVGSNDSERDVTIASVETDKTRIISSFTAQFYQENVKAMLIGARLLNSTTVRTNCTGQTTDQIDYYTGYIQVVEYK